jgi:hypothetical protein
MHQQNNDRLISRRTLARGVAWSTPAIVTATTVPALATSKRCEPLVAELTASPTVENPVTFTARAPQGRAYTIEVASTKDNASTEYTQDGRTFNMTRSRSGWNGGGSADGSRDRVFEDFTPVGALVLNQRSTAISDGRPSQTLTFTFLDPAGAVFEPYQVAVEVIDISSAFSHTWRSLYWDQVGFSVTPSSISSTRSPGVGEGSLARPFRRAGNSETTARGFEYRDTFSFDSVPGGTFSMQYSNYLYKGWQFIAISSISFAAEECV